jgi:NAD(P)-dependent dehydrogenase (short-subunit alcohol dehydrogenase family)
MTAGRNSTSRAALVTGCSSGIGRATALRLHRTGLAVYATARRVEALAELAEQGIQPLRMDVTDEASMVAAVNRVDTDHGAVRVLVNNAGHELVGPFEEVSMADVRRQFETNVFGLIRLTQLVLPGMREYGEGRIVNLSSIFGRFAVPAGAFYDATKHAVAALSDALRLELAPFGIRVIQIEPTAARTDLNSNAVWAGSTNGPYAELHRRLDTWATDVWGPHPRTIAGRFTVSADDVARAIERAITTRRPRARYPVGVLAHGLFLLRRWLPDPAFDAFVRSQFPTP